MSTNKTIENDGDVDAFLASVENPQRKSDALAMLDMMARVTGLPAKMWGAAIIGFGTYHYKYASGREGDFMRVGFSPRKGNLAVYIISGVENFPEITARIGKFKNGKSCFYINKLDDINMDVMEELVLANMKTMSEQYGEQA